MPRGFFPDIENLKSDDLKKKHIFAFRFVTFYARVAELVDALDSKSCSFGSAGSIPASGTKKQCECESESEKHERCFFSSHTPAA
jgi:hypothetical protein